MRFMLVKCFIKGDKRISLWLVECCILKKWKYFGVLGICDK